MINFGMKLKQLRVNRGLTQNDLAAVLEVNRATISGYETGGVYPSVEIMKKIAEFFGVSADYLMGLSNDKLTMLGRLTPEQTMLMNELAQEFTSLNEHQK